MVWVAHSYSTSHPRLSQPRPGHLSPVMALSSDTKADPALLPSRSPQWLALETPAQNTGHLRRHELHLPVLGPTRAAAGTASASTREPRACPRSASPCSSGRRGRTGARALKGRRFPAWGKEGCAAQYPGPRGLLTCPRRQARGPGAGRTPHSPKAKEAVASF